VAGALAAYRRAIEIDPKLAPAHGALGEALLEQGRFAEAKAATRRCLELLAQNHPQRQHVTQQLRQCERLLALNEKLPAILKAEVPPAHAAERIELAQLCQQHKGLYAASARFYAEAFADRPRLAEDLQTQARYRAACAAALAAAGQGRDAGGLDEPARARLRRQALDWLRADLDAWARVVEKGPPPARSGAQGTLQKWRKDPDLAGLRDQAALGKLPPAERQACRKLWADVDALLKRAQPKPKPTPEPKAPDRPER
jgi:hypothetical protein